MFNVFILDSQKIICLISLKFIATKMFRKTDKLWCAATYKSGYLHTNCQILSETIALGQRTSVANCILFPDSLLNASAGRNTGDRAKDAPKVSRRHDVFTKNPGCGDTVASDHSPSPTMAACRSTGGRHFV